jgi:hypothetical protein
MRTFFLILCLLCCTGCQVAREMKLCRVIDVDSLQPISGAKVWMQPYAPFHPFWPSGDQGVTDANGEVKLSLPKDFWLYLSSAEAKGYTEINDPERDVDVLESARDGAWWMFYMKRNTAGTK